MKGSAESTEAGRQYPKVGSSVILVAVLNESADQLLLVLLRGCGRLGGAMEELARLCDGEWSDHLETREGRKVLRLIKNTQKSTHPYICMHTHRHAHTHTHTLPGAIVPLHCLHNFTDLAFTKSFPPLSIQSHIMTCAIVTQRPYTQCGSMDAIIAILLCGVSTFNTIE